jgi:tetratricopeptide (TPR) repeat protein
MTVYDEKEDGTRGVYAVPVLQYYALLDLYGTSVEVEEAIKQHTENEVSTLEELRCGKYGLAPSTHPILSYYYQLLRQMKAEVEQTSDCSAETAIASLFDAFQLITDAESCAQASDFDSALEIIEYAFPKETVEDTDDDVEVDESMEQYKQKQVKVLPTYLLIKLLLLRANYYLQTDCLEEAYSDCIKALAYHPRSSQVYAILSMISKKNDELEKAAKECLASFLLGGCSDPSKAAEAEDACRLCCRASAKEVYGDRVKSNDGAVSQLQFVPKSWLVKSYLAGYAPLCVSLLVDPLKNDNYDVIYKKLNSDEVLTKIKNNSGDAAMHQIDEDDVLNFYLSVSATPTAFMNSIDSNDNGEAVTQELPLDRIAYWLLRRLVSLLDGILIEGSSEVHDAEDDSAIAPPTAVLRDIAISRSPDTIETLIDKINGGSTMIDVGVCDVSQDVTNEVVSAEETPRADEVTCQPFVSCLNLLLAPISTHITGVVFDATGTIVSVSDSTNCEDEESVWESCDDDEEADEPDVSEVPEVPLDADDKVSHQLRARLLSICSVISYLSGDAVGAVSCLRTSLQEDPANDDTRIKLGSLLVDMDEEEDARSLLTKDLDSDNSDPIVHLHLAELDIHGVDFASATTHLYKAKRLAAQIVPFASPKLSNRSAEVVSIYEKSIEIVQANICALLGVSLFRQNPTQPDRALYTLQDAVDSFPNSLYLMLSLGEVQAQAGDMVNALKSFKKASKIEPSHPFPYINAARTYQQLSQFSSVMHHLDRAIAIDPCLAMTKVDLSQSLLRFGKTEDAVKKLDEAMLQARHVSEIHDVLTARMVAKLQDQLKDEDITIPVY